MDHKKLDLEVIVEKEKEDLLSLERRRLFKKTGKIIYTAPILVLLSSSLDALDPPEPPEAS